MTLQEKNDLELIHRFHDEFGDIRELSDDDLDNIEENYSEELFEDVDDILEELSEIFN